MPDPDKRVVINELVCEGCGDCGVQSNCLSVVPVETEFGRKRAIDQSSCNKDFSCLKGFCPSFVTVHGGKLKKRKAARSTAEFAALPEPALPALDEPYGILITGVGGTGVVTIGALLGMAAHLEGKGCTVARHDRPRAEGRRGVHPYAHRREAGGHPCRAHRRRQRPAAAGLRHGGRRRASMASPRCSRARRWSIINSHEPITGDFTRKPDLKFPAAELERLIERGDRARRAPTSSTAPISPPRCCGDSIATNLFMLGYAYQKGLVPVSAAAHRAGDRAERHGRRRPTSRPSSGAAAPPMTGAPSKRRSPRRTRRRRATSIATTLDEIVGAARRRS